MVFSRSGIILLSLATMVHGHPPGPGGSFLEPPDPSKELGRFEASSVAESFALDNAEVLPGAPWLPGLAAGKARVPVILVCFPETPEKDKVPPELVRERFFGTGENRSRSVGRYLHEISHGKIHLEGVVTPWITMPKAQAEYVKTQGTLSREFFETLSGFLPNHLVKMDEFDCDELELDAPPKTDDNEIDGPVILLAAEIKQVNSAASLGAFRSWIEWTGTAGWAPGQRHDPIMCGGVKLSSYCVSSVFKHKELFHDAAKRQLFDIGTVAHEVLHLYGLPDLYYDPRNEAISNGTGTGIGVGGWCAMSSGSYGRFADASTSAETSPMMLNPLMRGWLNPEMELMAEQDGIYPCEPASHRGRYWRIPLDEAGGQRALLVEFRNADANADQSPPPNAKDWDQQLDTPGFLIWEVDESVGLIDGIRRNRIRVQDKWLIRLVQQDAPHERELNAAPASASDLWTSPAHLYQHPESKIILSDFDTTKGQFTLKHPAAAGADDGVAGAPAVIAGEALAASPASLDDVQFLRSLDASLVRLAKMPEAMIDAEPGLQYREALRLLHRNLQGGGEKTITSGEVSLRPNEAPKTHAEVLLSEIASADRAEHEVKGVLREDSSTFYSLENLTLPKSGTQKQSLDQQWRRVQEKLGSPAAMKWTSQEKVNEAVEVVRTAATSTKGKTRISQVLRRPTVASADGKDLQIFGAELLSTARSDGTADHSWIFAVKPEVLEELAETMKDRKTEITREKVEAFCREKLRLGNRLRQDGWKFTQGVEAATGKETWQVEIPLSSGRGSLMLDLNKDEETRSLKIVRLR